jgi:predicted porin
MNSLLSTIAVACIASTASMASMAQSSVTLYGSLDAGAYSKQLSGETRMKTLTSGIMNASRWGISGSEDLGDGLKARFDLSSYISMDTGIAGRNGTDGFWQRYSWVGLEGKFGLARMGRMSTPNFINTIRFNPFADSSLSPVFMQTYVGSGAQPMMTSHGTTDSAWSNSLAYTTPVWSGLQVALQAAANEGTGSGRRLGGSAYYGAGPFTIGLSLENLSRMSLNFSKPPASILMSDAKSIQLGTSYDLGVVKFFAQGQHEELENASVTIKLKTGQIGASVPIGLGKLLVSYARTDKTQTAVADLKRDTASVGYDYFLSKRTDLYAVVNSDKVTNLNRGTGVALGIRHNF